MSSSDNNTNSKKPKRSIGVAAASENKTDSSTGKRSKALQSNNLSAITNSTTNNDKSWVTQAEQQDLDDLLEIATEATVVEFDGSGRPHCPSFLPPDTNQAINGLIKTPVLPPSLLSSLQTIHQHIQSQIGLDKMVPWAGVGEDSRRLRGFGILGKHSHERLLQSDVRLHAKEKTGEEAALDEAANLQAVCILEDDMLDLGQITAQHLISFLTNGSAAHDSTCITSSTNVNTTSSLPTDLSILKKEELIAYQPNLHNGARHLSAHLDWPLHEGFGKVLVTVAMKGSATILLIAGDEDEATGVQPAWRFHLNQGECYVLSGDARNKCLHAVIADESDASSGVGPTGKITTSSANGFGRESLNLRFGLHTAREAQEEISRHWPSDDEEE